LAFGQFGLIVFHFSLAIYNVRIAINWLLESISVLGAIRRIRE